MVRASFLSLREAPFVDAARVAGRAPARILYEGLPNVLAPIVVTASLDVAAAILLEAGLGFFGLGDPNLVSWGGMLNQAQQYLRQAWWMSVFPGLAISLVVLAFNVIGDGLNDALNPRLREARDRSSPRLQPPPPQAGSAPILDVRGLVTEIGHGGAHSESWTTCSLTIGAGEIVGLVGESGCGKSMTAFSILGLFPTPAARSVGGEILFRGRSCAASPNRRSGLYRGARIGMVFQDPSSFLDPLMPVGQQVAETLRSHGQRERRRRARAGAPGPDGATRPGRHRPALSRTSFLAASVSGC